MPSNRLILAACLAAAGLSPALQARQLASTPGNARPAGPRLAAPPSTPPPIRSAPQQRPPASAPIRSVGPSQPRAIPTPGAPDARPATASAAPVRDLQGRPVPGAVPLSPTQALDPATGRTIQTLPSTPVPR